MRLKEGNKAKLFSVTDFEGNNINLEDYKEKKLLLSFFRYASCALCNLRISQLIQEYDALKEKGLFIIAFFQSSMESMEQYVGKQEVPFPLIPDPERKIYKLFGVEKSWIKFIKGGLTKTLNKAHKKGFKTGKREGQVNLVPADFLIENLVIKRAYYGNSIADHLPLKEIYQFLGTTNSEK